MRGRADRQPKMFVSIDLEGCIRSDHPLRPLGWVVDRILAGLSDRFAAACSRTGRPGVPPERLLKALLLMASHSVRSERQLVERIDTDLLFRWFLEMDPAEEVFEATACTHHRSRLNERGLTAAFFEAVVELAVDAGLVSDEHFSVDGTLIASCASIKSLRPIGERQEDSDGDRPDGDSFKARNPLVDFRGRKRSDTTHRSATDPEARLDRKAAGQETKLAHLGRSPYENLHGLVIAVEVTEANGTAEREAALAMLDRARIGGRSRGNARGMRSGTLGADKGYDSGPFCLELESSGIEPHVATKQTTRNPETVRPGRRAATCGAAANAGADGERGLRDQPAGL